MDFTRPLSSPHGQDYLLQRYSKEWKDFVDVIDTIEVATVLPPPKRKGRVNHYCNGLKNLKGLGRVIKIRLPTRLSIPT